MYLSSATKTNYSHNWSPTYSWPIKIQPAANIGAMVALSKINLYSDDDVAAYAYILGYRTTQNNNIDSFTSGQPSVIFLNGCTKLIFALELYGSIRAEVTMGAWGMLV
jgi:hypothetical protein